MKKILLLLSALVLVFSGCGTTAPVVAEPEKEEPVVETVEEEVVETRIIDVYLPVSEILSASDGIVDGFIEYSYDETGNLLEKTDFDREKKLLTRMVNEVSGGNIVRTQWFRGEDNEPGIYILKEYEGKNLVKEISYDIKDTAQSVSSYEYDGMNNVVRWTVSSGDNVPMMLTEYEYVGEHRTKAVFMTPLGDMEGYIEYSWAGDLLETEVTFDKDGDLEKSVAYEYSDGHLIRETHYKKTVISHTVEYELDEHGNALKKKHYYRSGNLKAQWDYEYTSVKKEVQL